MKLSTYLLLFALIMLNPVQGQVDSTTDATNPSPGAGTTIINSDELHMDQLTHIAVFTGNVIVDGTNLHMTCDEMTVFFTNANKIDHIIAKENVIITQPDRITHCGQAIYYHDDDKFVLTDQPNILDNKNQIFAPEITIFREKKSLYTKGHTRTIIVQGIGSSTNSPSAVAPGAK